MKAQGSRWRIDKDDAGAAIPMGGSGRATTCRLGRLRKSRPQWSPTAWAGKRGESEGRRSSGRQPAAMEPDRVGREESSRKF